MADLRQRVESCLKVGEKNLDGLEGKLKHYFEASGVKNAVVGLSGGVDSSLACFLAASALGPKNVFAYHLPYDKNPADERDALGWAKKLGVKARTVSIKPVVDKFASALKPAGKIAFGNLLARTRMVSLYNFASGKKAIVVGTGNRTELLLGYFTKYGDGGVDVLPLGGAFKTQVWRLADIAGVPQKILDKVPSAGLWKGQTDEGELGASYAEMDFVLCARFDFKASEKEIAKFVSRKKVDSLLARAEQNTHKLSMPPVLKLE